MSNPTIELQVILNRALLGALSPSDILDLGEEITVLFSKQEGGSMDREKVLSEVYALIDQAFTLMENIRPAGGFVGNFFTPAPQRKVGREEIEQVIADFSKKEVGLWRADFVEALLACLNGQERPSCDHQCYVCLTDIVGKDSVFKKVQLTKELCVRCQGPE